MSGRRMQHINRTAAGSLLAAATGFGAVAPALAGDHALSAAEREAGFRMLFNGENLDGWMEVQGRPGTFSVKDGILLGHRKGRNRLGSLPPECEEDLSQRTNSSRLRKAFTEHDLTLAEDASITIERPGSRWQVLGPVDAYSIRKERGQLNVYREGSAYWLGTQRMYGDFELRLQYRLPPGGNSGVFIRAPHHGRTSMMGMEIQLLDDRGREPDKGRTGSIYRVVAPSEITSKPAGEWNDLAILCHGERIRVTINGKVVTDARMADHEELNGRFRKGYIGLSAHSHTAEYRNVRLREILGYSKSP